MAAVFAAVVVAWLKVAVSMTGTWALASKVEPARMAANASPATTCFVGVRMLASYFAVAGVK
jgi:hypothetical protein